MKNLLIIILFVFCSFAAYADKWPDGTKIAYWFSDTTKVDVKDLGKQYVITDYGVSSDSTIIQTEKIQAVIDRCSEEGGGVVVLPRGTYVDSREN